MHLHRDNSFVVPGWIIDDVGEVAVQRQQNGVDFLSLTIAITMASADSTGKTSLKRKTS